MRLRMATGWAAAGVLTVAMATTAAAQTTTTSTEQKAFQIISVDGNTVVVKGAAGAQQITVPDDFRFTVDGRQVSVRELKPGMKGMATITTKTTTTPVYVTEVKNGEVMKVLGNSIIVRSATGVKMYSEADAARPNLKLVRDGQPMAFGDIREGDKLTATIVTEKPPKVMSERQVQATLAAVASGASPAAAVAAAAAAPVEATKMASAETGYTARKLPKTASPVPAAGILGAASLLLALTLALRRRHS